MNLVPLPAFEDNYIWMLHDGHNAVVVDPGDATPVFAALQERGLVLQGILVTHHHGDHTGGVATLRNSTACSVYGPARESIPEPYQKVSQGAVVTLLGLSFTVMDVPGHTAGHIAFYCPSLMDKPLVFCGDTLFSGGCGRLFEGTPAQMLASLEALSALPDDTQVCCTHEYTLSNLKFAREVDPDNAELQAYQAQCQNLRQKGLPTLPSTMARERHINPFLRSHLPGPMASARKFDPAATDHLGAFSALRSWKNQYR